MGVSGRLEFLSPLKANEDLPGKLRGSSFLIANHLGQRIKSLSLSQGPATVALETDGCPPQAPRCRARGWKVDQLLEVSLLAFGET